LIANPVMGSEQIRGSERPMHRLNSCSNSNSKY
jgi:hypothetical protein